MSLHCCVSSWLNFDRFTDIEGRGNFGISIYLQYLRIYSCSVLHIQVIVASSLKTAPNVTVFYSVCAHNIDLMVLSGRFGSSGYDFRLCPTFREGPTAAMTIFGLTEIFSTLFD